VAEDAWTCEADPVFALEALQVRAAAEASDVLKGLVAASLIPMDAVVYWRFQEGECILILYTLQLIEFSFVLSGLDHVHKVAGFRDISDIGAEDGFYVLKVHPKAILKLSNGRVTAVFLTLLNKSLQEVTVIILADLGQLPRCNCLLTAVRVATALGIASTRSHVAYAAAECLIRLGDIIACFVNCLHDEKM